MVNRRPIEIAGKFTTPPLLALAGGGFCGQGAAWVRPSPPAPLPPGEEDCRFTSMDRMDRILGRGLLRDCHPRIKYGVAMTDYSGYA